MDEQTVEVVAAAIGEARRHMTGGVAARLPSDMGYADAALAAIKAAGYVIAPLNPTPAMIAAVSDDPNMREALAETWRRMAEAAGR
jgi:hypothetical protein